MPGPRRLPSPAERRAAGSDGLSLAVLDWGGPGEPLLLLHGFGHGARIWEPFAADLSARYRVLAYDARGHGESDRDPRARYLHVEFTRDLAAAVESLGLERLGLVGHSMGGYTAIRFAAEQPLRITRLVLIETPADISPPSAAEAQRADPDARGAAPDPSFESEAQYAALLARRHPGAPRDWLEALARHWLRRRADGRFELKLDREALKPRIHEGPRTGQPLDRAAWALEESAHLWECLRKIPAPTLVVRGGRSPVFRAEVQERMVREALARGRAALVPEAGHVVMLDAPDALRRELDRFLLGEG
jgi:pimeloyl-ACP methyl ester carboxylesterase